ncbi:G protein-regulated inducer of neurite outgrowth 3 isoform X1 [Pogona vitticeps]
MGTVPDPLRSAKLALIAASEEENGLEELKSPKHQQKQASIERSSNGYPFSAKVQPAGEHSFDMNHGTEASMPRGEHHCGCDISKSPVFSPGSSSLSKEDRLAAAEPVKNSRQEGNNGCNAKKQALTDSHILMNTAIKDPSAQEDCKIVQSGTGGPLCSQVDDKTIPSSGGVGGVMENKTHNNNSSLLPTPQGAQQVAPTAKETVTGSSDLEKTQVPPLAKEMGLVSDHGLKANVCLDAELRDTKNASSYPSVRTVQEPLPKSNLERSPQTLSHNETAEEALPEVLKFKDTGTMTVQLESRPAEGETISRSLQDAEVQAVASVESRSASTSPSILAAFLRENMPSEAKQKQEQLHIIYRGASGKEHSEIMDNLAVLGQTAPSTGILPKVRIQAPAGAEKWSGAQAVTLQVDLAGKQDAACLSLLDNSEHPCPAASGSTQEISVKGMEVQIADGARSPGSIAQQLLDPSALQNTKPVCQISAHASDQPVVPPQPANLETKLPPCSALSEISSKHQNLGPSATENQLAPLSCPRVLELAKPLVTNATESNQQNQPQIKTLGDVEMGPTGFHVGAKSKTEGTVIHFGPKEQKMNAIGVPAGPQTVGVPVTLQTGQDISPGDNREVEALPGQKLAAGRPESELSSNSALGLLAKIGAKGKESKLAVPAAASSVQPVPSPCKKKKEIKPVPFTKGHVKQSKHVRDVVWDEQGMTWEVYGASLDPESLGVAIQNHLQRQIREHEKLIKAQSAQTRKSISSDTSSNKKLKGRQHNVFRSMLQNFRRPNCCVRPTASSVLD